MAQWWRQRTCTQQTWVQFPLVPIWVTDGGRKGIWPKVLPNLVGMSEPLNKLVNDVKFGRNGKILVKQKSWSRFITNSKRSVASETSHRSKIFWEFIDDFLSYQQNSQNCAISQWQKIPVNISWPGLPLTSNGLLLVTHPTRITTNI